MGERRCLQCGHRVPNARASRPDVTFPMGSTEPHETADPVSGATGRIRVPSWVIAVFALVIGSIIFFVNGLSASACGWDTSYCAHADQPHLWVGRVYDQAGRPTAATIRYWFSSAGRPGPAEVELATDSAGRFCLRWPTESGGSGIGALNVHGAGPADPRLSGYLGPEPLIVTPDARGGDVSLDHSLPGRVQPEPWDPRTDMANTCVTKSPPWDRIDNLQQNWRYRLLLYISLGAIVLGVAGLILQRTRAARVISWLALSTAGISVVLFVLIWQTHRI